MYGRLACLIADFLVNGWQGFSRLHFLFTFFDYIFLSFDWNFLKKIRDYNYELLVNYHLSRTCFFTVTLWLIFLPFLSICSPFLSSSASSSEFVFFSLCLDHHCRYFLPFIFLSIFSPLSPLLYFVLPLPITFLLLYSLLFLPPPI